MITETKMIQYRIRNLLLYKKTINNVLKNIALIKKEMILFITKYDVICKKYFTIDLK